MYVVLGATGNTGSVVAKKLLERGEKVRAVGRDAAKLAQLFPLGAQSGAEGAAAAEALQRLEFSGVCTRELLGQRDVTHDEGASAIGAGIGKPKLSYQKFPSFLVEQGMKQMGIPGKTASLMSEMNEAANDGLLNPEESRSEKNTTPTAIEIWVKEVFAPVYNAKAAGA